MKRSTLTILLLGMLLCAATALASDDLSHLYALLTGYSEKAVEAAQRYTAADIALTLDERETLIYQLGVARGYEAGMGAASVTPDTARTVWISTEGGHRYHKSEICSGLKYPYCVSVQEAEYLGYTSCQNCH